MLASLELNRWLAARHDDREPIADPATLALSKFASPGALTIHVSVDVRPKDGVSKAKIDEVKVALHELGLDENVKLERE